MKTALIISNGLGEDSIGVQIAASLQNHINIMAMPMVGQGLSYQKNDIALYCPSTLPSDAGNRNYQNTLLDDIKAGAISSLFKQIQSLRKIKNTEVIVVGDVFPLLITYLAGIKKCIYLDVYKSHHISRYAETEKWLLKKTTQIVYTRDHVLKNSLMESKIAAACHGNILLDGLPDHQTTPLDIIKESVLLLPGSRADKAYLNLRMMLEAISNANACHPINIYIAKAPGLDFGSIYQDFSFKITETQGLVKQALLSSKLVISAAGTSQQQAISTGRPVIGLMTPDTRTARKKLIRQLNGPLFFDAENAKGITAHLNHLEQNPLPQETIKKGMRHLGEPGALEIIAQEVIQKISDLT